MNRLSVIIILILLGSAFGQRFESTNNDNYTLKDAVNRYNRSNYTQTKHILQNLPFDEQLQYKEDIKLLLMKTEYNLNNFSESRTIGKDLLQNYPSSEYLSDIYMIFGDIFFQENKFESAYRLYLRSLSHSHNKKAINKASERIFKTLQYGISEQMVDELLLTEIDKNVLQVLLLSKAHIAFKNGQYSLYRDSLSNLDRGELNSAAREYYDKLYERSDQELKNMIIPVILPLTGKNSKTGIEFLDGLKFAQLNNTYNGSDVSFIIYDNESDQLRTIKLLDKISQNKNIAAILGPIENESTILAGSFAKQFDIPIFLPNSVNDELSSISDNLIFLNSDLEVRGRVAAQTIYKDLQAANIAVLAPADGPGKRIVNAFMDELNRFGISPIVTEWYAGTPLKLDRQFNEIRARAWELKAQSDSNDVSSKFFFYDSTSTLDSTSSIDSTYYYGAIVDSMLAVFKAEEKLITKKDSAKVVLNDIDAIYMPINSNDLEYIGAQFPAYNLETIVVGNDYWTDLNVLKNENIGPHLKRMIVISNYNYHKINQLNSIIDQKRTMYFYQAIDAYNLLLDLVQNSVDEDKSINQIINDSYLYMGVFGVYNFEYGNNVNSNLNILEFNGHAFDVFERVDHYSD